MNKLTVFIIIFFSAQFCIAQGSDDYSLLLKEMSYRKICIKTIKGKTECLKIKRKKVYISPVCDSLYNYMYLKTNCKEFESLLNNNAVIDSIQDNFGRSIVFDSKQVKWNLINEKQDADIIMNLSHIFSVGNQHFCIIKVTENLRIWIVRIKCTESQKLYFDIDLIQSYQ